jgi:hypothetical protein
MADALAYVSIGMSAVQAVAMGGLAYATLVHQRARGARQDNEHTFEEGRADGVTDATVRGLKEAMDRAFRAIENATEQAREADDRLMAALKEESAIFRKHEKECAADKALLVSGLERVGTQLAALESRQGSTERQVGNISSKGAAEVLRERLTGER